MATLESDLCLAMDPARLMEAAGMAPDPWQRDVLRSGAPRALLNCSRQSGKSTTTAALALHEALYQDNSLVLMLSPSLRQSGELFRKVLDVRGALGEAVAPQTETLLRLELANGSRIISLPGKEQNIRGYSGVRLLVVDEAARVPDELYFAIRPMLAVSGGRLIALSTPFGRRGWFYTEWTDGGPGWERVQLPASECPRISTAFLAEEQRALGRWWFEQEYGCQFLDTTDQVFGSEYIEAALDDTLEPLFSAEAA